ncbi:zf-HC2 domain-containing protein [Halobacillus litoralis]|uniref:anti-sigma factor family protein n=1 Tax=Halobacillus litoralis TaxID=45668 RepID=UPI001CD3E2FC|nr:zf-HC2 domain-containing protein [Halobacillus litoralis]MCA0972509.1 zf-HC2 domain-containing protein [Halobacillus litoralis]
MKHMEEQQMMRYIDGELTEKEQSVIESHFADCDDCFDEYLQMLDQSSPLSDSFTEEAVARIVQEHPTFKQNKKSNVLAHYLVAAGFTLLLMVSGVFSFMSDSIDEEEFKQQTSFSEQMMEKTGSLIDEITKR